MYSRHAGQKNSIPLVAMWKRRLRLSKKRSTFISIPLAEHPLRGMFMN